MLCAKIVWNCRRVRPGKQIFRNCIWFFLTILPTSCSRAWLFIWLIHPKDDSPNVMVLGKEDFKINNIVFNISPRRGVWSSIWAHWKSFWRVIWTKFDGSKEDFQKFSMIFFIAKQSYLGQGNYYSIFLHPNLKRFSDSGKTILKNVTKFDWNWSCCSEGKYVYFNYQWMLCVPNLNEIKRKMRNVCMITCADQIVSVWNLKKNDFRINMIQ